MIKKGKKIKEGRRKNEEFKIKGCEEKRDVEWKNRSYYKDRRLRKKERRYRYKKICREDR